MPAATSRTPAKPATRTRTVATVACRQFLTGQALLDDMEAYRKKVAATPDTARDFLTRLGVITPSGKTKKLIRG
jgi:transcriptional regulator of met regulon